MKGSPLEKKEAGKWVAIGIALGAAFGAAFDNLAIGVALGVAMGAAIGASKSGSAPNDTDAGQIAGPDDPPFLTDESGERMHDRSAD